MTDDLKKATPFSVSNPVLPEPKFGMLTSAPAAKVVAASTGAGVGSAAAQVIIYTIEAAARIDIPATVEAAGIVLLGSLAAYLFGYKKRPAERDVIVPAE